MLPQFRGAVVTIGNFDGVHLGHQTILRATRQLAQTLGSLPTLALSFEPHPQQVLSPTKVPERITGLRGKARGIEQSGVDALVVLRFSRTLAALQPEQFVRRILVDGLAVRAVLVGDNFYFGAGGQGNLATLQRCGQQFGFGVHHHALASHDNHTVSSTRIRTLIKAGHLAVAAALLGRAYEVETRVIQGHQRGQAMGFPTANMALAGMVHPPPGVYIVELCLHEQWLPAVANLGHNPTFGGGALRLETHILADEGTGLAHTPHILYHRVLRVRFLRHIRHEQTFPNSDALKRQIAADISQAKAFFKHTVP